MDGRTRNWGESVRAPAFNLHCKGNTMRNIFFFLSLLALCSSCAVVETPPEETVFYTSLKMRPEQDSLFMNAGTETRQMSLLGLIVNTSEKTITNTGVMTDARYTITTSDTVYQGVDPSKAKWTSSNPSVASVNNGLITASSAGYANISAKIGNASTASLVVNVRAVDSPPGLTLSPPSVMLIFENTAGVSGFVQQNAKLNVAESNSGFTAAPSANADGSFTSTVTGLNQGVRTIIVRATHPTNANVFTERSKVVIYYAPNSPEANSIVGDWIGTTLGKDFNFSISHSVIPTRYDISGKLDIQFEGAGLIRDIDLIGILNNNGTISATLSKSYNGFTISGKFSGYFKSTGTGEGEYSAQAVKSGWPKVSFNDTWTAIKKQ